MTLSIHSEKVPLMAGVKELAEVGLLPKAIEANRHYVEAGVSWNTASKFHQQVLLDPQTSGGLLFGLPADRVGEAFAKLSNVTDIGEVTAARDDGAPVEVRASTLAHVKRSAMRA